MFYIIPQFIKYLQNPEFVFLSKGMAFRFITQGSPLFMPSGFHLWYLGTYFYTLVIFLLLCNLKHYISILKWFVPICFLIGAFKHCHSLYVMISDAGWDYADLNLGLPFETCTTTGIPYFGAGMLCRYIHETGFKASSKTTLILIISVLIMGGVNSIEYEWILSLPHIDLSSIGAPLFTPIVSVMVFILVANSQQTKPTLPFNIGENYTLLVYVLHVFVIFLITQVIKDNPVLNQVYDNSGTIIVFMTTLLLSYTVKTRQGKIFRQNKHNDPNMKEQQS